MDKVSQLSPYIRSSVSYAARLFGNRLEKMAMNNALVIIQKIIHLLNEVDEFKDMRDKFKWFLYMKRGAAYRLRQELAYCLVEYHGYVGTRREVYDFKIEFMHYGKMCIQYDRMDICMRYSLLKDSIAIERIILNDRRITRIWNIGGIDISSMESIERARTLYPLNTSGRIPLLRAQQSMPTLLK